MSNDKVSETREIVDVSKRLVESLYEHFFKPMAASVEAGDLERLTLNPAFPYPREIRIGFLGKGVAIEYLGPTSPKCISSVKILNAASASLLRFLGIEEETVTGCAHYFGTPSWNTSFFLGDSIDRLIDLKYSWTSSNDLISFGGYNNLDECEDYSFWSNTTLFWTDKSGQLRVRHVDFLEFFALSDANYRLPIDVQRFENVRHNVSVLEIPQYDTKLHNALNRFIDLIHGTVRETDITSFLEAHPELLELAFSSRVIYSQVKLKWQNVADLPDLRPDFLIQRMDGFCDILEFKLPKLKSAPIVGTPQRRQPSSEVDSAMAQLDLYEKWMEQDINKAWLEREENIRVMHPQRLLVIGMRDNFPDIERQRLRKTRNTTVYSYDEFISLARHQLHRIR